MFRVLRKRDLQSTDKLNQEKCQATLTTICSGEKVLILFLLSRSGNEWLVQREGGVPVLKATVQENPLIPPTTGWKFNPDLNPTLTTKEYEEDPQLRCSSTPTSSSCIVTVSLSGEAKEFQGECIGQYNDTGLRSAGKKVIQISI